MNPLLNISFRVPFDQIQASQVEPAIDELLADANRRLGETIASPDPLHALDTMTERLEYAMNVVRHLESVATTPELRAAFNAVQPKVSVFYSSLPLNEDLWKAIKRYAATAEGEVADGGDEAVSDQDHRFVQAAWRGFASGGQGAAEGDRRRADRGDH